MDFLDFIRKEYKGRKHSLVQKGGGGSGWFGPPKGTHGAQAGVGAKVARRRPQKPTISEEEQERAPIKVSENVGRDELVGELGSSWRAYEGEAYRGPSKFRQPGRRHPNVYGGGTYYAIKKEGAKAFTDEPRKTAVKLENALFLTSKKRDEKFREFVERDTNVRIDYPWPTSRLAERAMTAWLKDNLYDGIVIDYDGAPGGRQVVVFTE